MGDGVVGTDFPHCVPVGIDAVWVLALEREDVQNFPAKAELPHGSGSDRMHIPCVGQKLGDVGAIEGRAFLDLQAGLLQRLGKDNRGDKGSEVGDDKPTFHLLDG
ncbi:hypothetical protein SDC9_82038 [bioreactor metagenome]|uniref:Uncharacterized protein n=1 Tax=bioreactor metagenome TaxID=1076179 RepID=A0A644Z3L7_9ZZZZ